MKHVIMCILFWLSVSAMGQESKIFIQVLQPERDNIPTEARNQLENKLKQLISSNGIADDDPNARFVITSKALVTSKDIIAGPPQKVSMHIDFVFFIGDMVENKVFENLTISTTGVGNNENKAMIAAIKNIKPQNKELVTFLEKGKNKIYEYFVQRCDQIKNSAQKKAAAQDYEGAIYELMQVPDICDCSKDCQDMMIKYNVELQNQNAIKILNKAKETWAANPNSKGASMVSDLLSTIPNNTTSQKNIESLIEEISKKLISDEKREWSFKMQQYRDSVAYQNKEQHMRATQQSADNAARIQAIDACRQVGLEYARHQPQIVTYQKNIVLW